MREQRRHPRFNLMLPVEVVRAGRKRVHIKGQTRNVSSCGVLFECPMDLTIGEAIEYTIILPTGSHEAGRVYIRCLGKVVRKAEPGSSADGQVQAVAATLERYTFVREGKLARTAK